MKKKCLFVLLIFISFFSMKSQAQKQITITIVPTTIKEFTELRNEKAVTPEGGAVMFLTALKVYNDNPELGNKFLVLAVDKSRLISGDVYKGYQLMRGDMNLIRRQLAQYKNIANSYIKGATAKNGYTVQLPYEYELTENPYSGNRDEGKFKNFVKCYGADSPRPIHTKRNNKGIWKAVNWSSVITGIKKPEIEEDDDL